MEMWGIKSEDDIEPTLVSSMARAYIELKERPEAKAYRVQVLDSGEIQIIEGPIEIISPDGRIYGDRTRPVLTLLTRAIFYGLIGASAVNAISGSLLHILLITLSLACIAKIHQWEIDAIKDAIIAGRRFMSEVVELVGIQPIIDDTPESEGDSNVE